MVPFLNLDPEGPGGDLLTTAIESIDVRIRKAVKAPTGHFPTETAALKWGTSPS